MQHQHSTLANWTSTKGRNGDMGSNCSEIWIHHGNQSYNYVVSRRLPERWRQGKAMLFLNPTGHGVRNTFVSSTVFSASTLYSFLLYIYHRSFSTFLQTGSDVWDAGEQAWLGEITMSDSLEFATLKQIRCSSSGQRGNTCNLLCFLCDRDCTYPAQMSWSRPDIDGTPLSGKAMSPLIAVVDHPIIWMEWLLALHLEAQTKRGPNLTRKEGVKTLNLIGSTPQFHVRLNSTAERHCKQS